MYIILKRSVLFQFLLTRWQNSWHNWHKQSVFPWDKRCQRILFWIFPSWSHFLPFVNFLLYGSIVWCKGGHILPGCGDKRSKVVAVYNWFFLAKSQAKRHRRDATFHAVGKIRTWVTVGGLPERGGVLCEMKEREANKQDCWFVS